MTFSENIRNLRRQYNMSQDELALRLGYKSFTTIQKWEDGTSNPPYRIIKKLSEIYDVPVEELMGKLSKKKKAPILGVVRAGLPILAEENVIGYEEVDNSDPYGDDYFFLKVVGDSMKNDRIMENDLLYVKKQNSIDNGQIGVILVDDEATVKRVYKKDGILTLQPSNENYQPLVFTKEQMKEHNIQILGKVISNKIRF